MSCTVPKGTITVTGFNGIIYIGDWADLTAHDVYLMKGLVDRFAPTGHTKKFVFEVVPDEVVSCSRSFLILENP